AGDLYVDDFSLVPGTVPATGTNIIRNGDFEGPLTTNVGGPWVFSSTNVGMTSISTTIKRSGNGGLHLVFLTQGSSTVYFYQDGIPIIPSSTYTLSFWYLATTNATFLTTRMGNFVSRINLRPVFFTPGALNSPAPALAAYPPL